MSCSSSDKLLFFTIISKVVRGTWSSLEKAYPAIQKFPSLAESQVSQHAK